MRSVLAVIFAATGLYSLVRLSTARLGVHRIGHVLRLGMSAAMVAMLGPWNAALPEPLGLTLFTAAALWFAYTAVFLAGIERHPWFDVGKMVAMVWMSVAMSPVATRPVNDMASMHMSSGGRMSVPVPTWSAAASVVVGLTLLATTSIPLRRLLCPQPLVEDAVAVAMAASMACSFLFLL